MAIRSARNAVRNPKREVCWDGRYYKVRSNKVEIPDLGAINHFTALLWLNQHTYARGYSRPNPLAGFGGAISIGVR